MKIKFSVWVGGSPAKLHLRSYILYGINNQYSKKVWNYEFSLDKVADFEIPIDYFNSIIEKEKDEYEKMGLEFKNAL